MENQQESTENRVVGKPFPKGVSGNLAGRPKESEETKAKKKALKQIVKEYIDKLADALPEISPALIEKAKTGDVSAIREIHDRVMGKPKQSIEVEANITNDLSEDQVNELFKRIDKRREGQSLPSGEA